MALVIEDGIGRANAQSYASVSDLSDYADARGVALPSGNTEREKLLMRAMDFMNDLKYVGNKQTKEQALDWPRSDVWIDGFPYPTTEIPRDLKLAQCAIACEAHKMDILPTTPANTSGPVTNKSVGEISISYADSGRINRVPIIQSAQAYLQKILRSNSFTLPVIRT